LGPERIRIDLGSNHTNKMDELACFHDVAYYKDGTGDLISSLLSTNKPTIVSDLH
jgi:hypothetical protein